MIEKQLKTRFIIGTPRSGKSLFFRTLAASGSFSWISEYHNIFNSVELSSIFNRIYDLPAVGPYIYLNSDKMKYLPHPIESNFFWEKSIPKFNSVSERNITLSEILLSRKIIRNICRYQSKNIFISEFSKWANIKLFLRINSETKFLHFVRDGRSVAYEYSKMIKKGIYKEWRNRNSWISCWPSIWVKEFQKYQNSALAYCAMLWKFQLKSICEELKQIDSEKYLEIRYEKFVNNPKKYMEMITDFFDIEYNENLKRYLNKYSFFNMNNEWRVKLNKKQISMLMDIIYEEEYTKYFDG